MERLNTGFLGSTSERFQMDFCTISIVNYQNPVSEDWHSHEKIHLSLILQGGNLESRKREDIQVSTGAIILYHEEELHRNRYTLFPSKNLNLEFDKAFFKKEDLNFNGFVLSKTRNPDNLFNLLKIYHELYLNDSYSSESIFFSLLALFAKKGQSSLKPSWLNNLKEILEDRWNEFVLLDELAKQINVHPVTISKYFRKYFHCTLSDYMRKIKIEKAVYLLMNTRKSITEIAFLCGFSDQSHFIRVFKAYVGFNPKRFRKI